MTNQDAIERIRLVHCWTDINNNPTINTCECSLYMNNDGLCENCEYNIAIECIKRQIPKKPIQHGELYDDDCWFECPTCKKWIASYWKGDNPYCDECGQAIDWSDNE